jgi:pantoate--beta-alanine ligase
MSSTEGSTESATGPRIVREIRELQRWADGERASGRRIALVPTMGALHEGHLSLVRRARACADRVVASVFVNPTQFGPGEDFDRYPRDLDGDAAKLGRSGCDVVFAPSAGEMYPDGDCTWVEVEGLTDGLCGRDRPGHFRGVTTVVTRLLNAAKPHIAVFGEKDYQQLVVVRRLVRDLHIDVDIVAAPTVREPDGVAMSSRNALLERSHRAPARREGARRARRLRGASLCRDARAARADRSTGRARPCGPVRCHAPDRQHHAGGGAMTRTMLKSKLHRVTVTESNLDYEGSITIDRELMRAADLLPHEKVDIYDITNGARLATYVIPGEAGSGVIGINGAAAHLVKPGDLAIIASYVQLEDSFARRYAPRICFVDARNRLR